MKKKIFLYLTTLFVAVAVFWWIKSGFSGSGGWRTKQHPIHPIPVFKNKGMANLVVEVRSPKGVLEYVLRARQAIPKGNGRYLLTDPSMQFYSSGNQTTIIASDMGDVYVDQVGGAMSSHIYPRKGKLFGHPTITMGPLNSFIPGVRKRQLGQMQIRFARQVSFNYQQGVILSSGAIHLRSDQADFDGVGLTAQIDLRHKKLTYLRIDKGLRLVLRHVYKSGPGLAATSSEPPVDGTHGEGPTPAKLSPPMTPATTAVSASPAAVVYRLDFIDNVNARIGPQNIQAHRFIIYFSGGNTTAPPKTASPVSAPAATHPAPMAPIRHSTAGDLFLTWTGPMIMRPKIPKLVHLLGPKDIFFEARGQTGHPVRMTDGKTLSALAQELTYQTQPQILKLIPAAGAMVVLKNQPLGTAHCQAVTFNRLTNRVFLAGPGTTLLTTPHGKANGDGWLATWQKSVHLQLASTPDTRHPGRNTLAVRRVILHGNAGVKNAGLSIHGDELAAWLTAAGPPGQPQALQRMLAKGHVQVISHSSGSTGAPANGSRMTCDQLLIQSVRLPGQKTLEPHALLATGHVHLKLTQRASKTGRAPTVYTIVTPRLAATLAPVAARRHQPGHPSSAAGRFTVTWFRATHSVQLRISNMGRPIVATATAMRGDRRTGVMELTGGTAANSAAWATISQQGNFITGPHLILQQKAQSIHARGPGKFVILRKQSANGTVKPGVQILWQKSMAYHGTSHKANFVGTVTAKLLSQPDQQSRLACHQLAILLARPTGGGGAGPDAAGQLRLVDLQATAAPKHQLSAMNASFNPQGLLQTRLYIQSNSLHYNALLRRLTVAGPGQMSLEDYRGESVAKRRAAEKTPQASPLNRPRGQSAFAWSRGLRYHGNTGVLSLRGRVRMVYKPLHPLQASLFGAARGAQGAKQTGNAGGQARFILLDCRRLMARLTRPTQTKTSTMELGMGGPMKLDFVHAQQAALELMGVRLTADVLKFSTAKQQAVAVGLNGHEAVVSSKNGQAHGQARKIIWNLAKGRAGLIFIQPRGTISTH